MTTVDEFVKATVLPQHQDIVSMLRALMRETAPNAKEEISYGMPVWKGRKIFVWVSPTKKDITFAFSRGAEFEDKYSLLQGVGKRSRHVKINDLRQVKKAALRYYIKQALAFDAK
jgi:hypothetical protein